ncbi:MAG: DUF4418 family protein [Bacillota bacterium]|nr:DUF4418 family protein [Bacillota bacterium]
MKNKPTVGIITVVLGMLIALIPKVIFPVCTNMIELINGKSLFMRCHWTAVVELLIGMLIIFDGIFFILFKSHETRIALSIMMFLFGLSALLIPTAVIGMCETVTMKCRVGTEPALIVVSVIIMVIGIGNVISEFSAIKSEHPQKERSAVK